MIKVFAILCASATNVAFSWLALCLLGIGPITLNDGLAAPTWIALAANALLIISYGVLHSVMARPTFKAWWTQIIPAAAERSVYLLVAAVGLLALMWAWVPMPQLVWTISAAWAQWLIYGLFGMGLAFTAWAILALDPLGFYGLRGPFGLEANSGFSTKGPYKIVRHPIQTGLLLVLWAHPTMTAGHALFAALFTAYSLIAVYRLEEPDLVRAMGDEYRQYQRRVPGFVPWRYRR